MKYLTAAFKYLPDIIRGVMAVESAVIGTGKGTTKKSLVMAAIQAAAKAGETVDNAEVDVISKLIDEVVSVFNSSGIFSKTKTA